MAEIKWIKICTDIFDDEKILLIESMPEHDAIIVCWLKLLCLAGKQNNGGVFLLNDRIAYTDEMLATIFRRPLNTVRLALDTFEQFGMIERINGTVTIPNWSKHQSIDAMERSKAYHREYMAKKRAEQKALCDVNSDVNSEVNGAMPCDVTVNTVEKNRKDKENKRKDKEIYSGVPELNEAIVGFIEFRKGIGKKMTDRAIQLLINKLNGMTESVPEQIAILNQSIMNGWTSVYPLKGEQIKTEKPNSIKPSCKPQKVDVADLENIYDRI